LFSISPDIVQGAVIGSRTFGRGVVTDMMRAWVVSDPGPIHQSSLDQSTLNQSPLNQSPLTLVERPVPVPAPGEVLVRVRVCGVCRTDLHLAEGELAPRHSMVVPGHEVVGEVVQVGEGADRFQIGDRVGIAWLRHTCGACRWCRAGRENLCPQSRYTGWDTDGGYAEFAVVPAAFAYRIPPSFTDEQAAPLLCAGIIGYRSLLRAQLPVGGRLGIYGFGASAHLTAQLAIAQGAEVHVMTRGEEARELALQLGAASVGGPYDAAPVPLDSAIIFAPAGELVPLALESLGPSGTLALAGIHMSDIPALNYQRHLFNERTVCSVTSNTRRDGEEFLVLAQRLGVQVTTTPVPFEQADLALRDLAAGHVRGAAVLRMT
jgi:propanol-preferring alcohol dehydrogenase